MYNTILSACLTAYKGKNVVIVSVNLTARRTAIDIAKQISEGWAKFEGVSTLRFQNGNWIKFFLPIDLKHGATKGLGNYLEIVEEDAYRGGGFNWKLFKNGKEN